jgi:hypothetical protein
MKLVKTDETRPGQKVARDVLDLRGNLLFKAGTELTAELIQSCRERNVSHIFLEEAAAPSVSIQDEDTKRAILSRDVDRMFSGPDRNPLMAALREASKRYLRSRIR